MLNRPYAFACILRLRTSSEFKLGHSVSNFSWFSSFNLKLLIATDISPPIYVSMATSSLIHSMRMSSISSAVILLPHMVMTLSFPIHLVFPGINSYPSGKDMSNG